MKKCNTEKKKHRKRTLHLEPECRELPLYVLTCNDVDIGVEVLAKADS